MEKKHIDDTKKPLRVIAYYSKPKGKEADQDNYQKYAENLARSLDQFELALHIEAIESKGSWRANTRYKPKFVWRMLVRYGADYDLLYVDADAEFRQYPLLLDRLDVDLAAHQRPHHPEIQSGTIYLQYTKATFRFLEKWLKLCDPARPGDNTHDQQSMTAAKKATKELGFYNLPPEYCLMAGPHEKLYPDLEPVIYHHQASRKLKRTIT